MGMTVNDSLIRQYRVGGNLAWHITEPFWVGAHFAWYDLGELGGVTDEYNEVLSKTASVPDLVEVKWFTGGDVGYVPIYGKFAIFNDLIVYYDMSLFAGAGYLTHVTSQTDGQAGTVAGDFGVQQRLFLADWLALVLEVRDYAFMAELRDGTNFTNIVSLGAGASIFFPFTFDYTTLR
jgi:outer membrane beta-barrel protein